MTTKKQNAEHALSLIKAGIAAIPLVGGPIASLIGDYVPSATENSVNKSMEYLKDKLDSISKRIDVNAINKDEFTELFKNSYMTIIRTHQDIKLRAAANLMANILLTRNDPDRLSFNELDHYSRCLDSLSNGALEILSYTIALVSQKDLMRLEEQNKRIQFPDLQAKAKNIDPFFLMSMLVELNSFHLVHLPGSPEIRTSKYSNYPIELTITGYHFAKYILETVHVENAT